MSGFKVEKLTDVLGELVHETEDAYCIKVEDDTFAKEAQRYWLPKSQTENNNDGSFTIPEWLAIEKGLV
jgi:hypothetical protein